MLQVYNELYDLLLVTKAVGMGHSIFYLHPPPPPPIEVLCVSPPQKSRLLTLLRKEDQSANTLPLQDLIKD